MSTDVRCLRGLTALDTALLLAGVPVDRRPGARTVTLPSADVFIRVEPCSAFDEFEFSVTTKYGRGRWWVALHPRTERAAAELAIQ